MYEQWEETPKEYYLAMDELLLTVVPKLLRKFRE